ncbi:MAG: hypothetical protein ACRDUA_02590 [Micromonosporaceae bacterium]
MREPREPAVPPPPPPQSAAQTGAFVAPRTPGARAYLTVGVVIALVVGLLGGLYVVQQTMYGPEAAVRGYFGALADRDAKAALSYLAGTVDRGPGEDSGPGEDGGPGEDAPTPSLLTDAALKGDGYQPPSDVEIKEIGTPDGLSAEAASNRFAEATVGFRLGEQAHTTKVILERREETTYGVFHEWRLSGGVSTLNVVATVGAPVEVNGVPIRSDAPASEYGDGIPAFPGRYAVTLAENPLLEAKPLTVDVGAADAKAALDIQLKDSAREEAEEQVTAYLDECAESTELDPEGCPFSSYSYDTVTDVKWTIDEYPSIVVELGQEGYVSVRSLESGVASVTWKDSEGEKQDDETTFEVYGTVAASPSGVTFYPPD